VWQSSPSGDGGKKAGYIKLIACSDSLAQTDLARSKAFPLG